MIKLPSPKTTKKSTRIGRGIGSGRGGHTVGRGTKGQKSRSGYKKPRPGFEGGQNPLSQRLPKLPNVSGGNRRTRNFIVSKTINIPLNLSTVAEHFKEGEVITEETLQESKLISKKSHKKVIPKVLFDKEIDKKLTFKGVKLSASAKKAVESAGGKIEK